MYKYLFGPVPSRRLGMSLGVDLVPAKVCSLDCVYCEVGKTTKLTTERKEYVLFKKVSEELKDYFKNNPDPDYITFSGSGEPTLNSKLGDIIKLIKELRPNIPIAVLTNGTLLHNKQVREELLLADTVLPSLDAATDKVFEKLNRPAKDLTVKKHITGLMDFAKEFKGNLHLEVFILPEYNTNTEELNAMIDIIREINPQSVQLNTLDRPGTVSNLKPASLEQLNAFLEKLDLEQAKIISAIAKRKQNKAYRSDTEAVILETISRRPCTLQDLKDILNIHVNEINKYLSNLEDSGEITTVEENRGVFYKLS